MTGNVKPLLTDVTSKLIDILHGELPSENPSVSRIPRAQFTTPVKKQAANPQKFSMTSVDDLLYVTQKATYSRHLRRAGCSWKMTQVLIS